MKLTQLHENFIKGSMAPMPWGHAPIKATKSMPPIIPVEKWEIKGDPKFLTKTYRFQSTRARNEFLKILLGYEEESNHGSSMMIRDEIVKISLRTKTVEEITSLDREYAKFADDAFKDVIIFSGAEDFE
jgi:pterin-4a-carbinolamine dehydratase